MFCSIKNDCCVQITAAQLFIIGPQFGFKQTKFFYSDSTTWNHKIFLEWLGKTIKS